MAITVDQILATIQGMGKDQARMYLESVLTPSKKRPAPDDTPVKFEDVDYLTGRLKRAQAANNLADMRLYSERLKQAISLAPAAPGPDRAEYDRQVSRVQAIESELAGLNSLSFKSAVDRDKIRRLNDELVELLRHPLPAPGPLPERAEVEGGEDEF